MKQVALALSLAGLSFIMTVIWGGPLLRILRHYKIGKIIRVEEPSHHSVKMGTPTMGGVMFIVPVLLLTILLNAVALIGFTQSGVGRSVLVPMIVMVCLRDPRRCGRLAGYYAVNAKGRVCGPAPSSYSRSFLGSALPGS